MAEMKNVIRLRLDTQRPNIIYEERITQNDTVEFLVTLTQAGAPFDLSGGIPSLAVEQPDNFRTVTVLPGTVVGKEISFKLGSTETATPGEVEAAVQIYGTDGRVSSLPFSFRVIRDKTAGETKPSEREATLIEVVLQEGQVFLEDAKAAASEARKETSRLTGAVGGAISSLNEDKAAAIEEMQTAAGNAITSLNTEKTSAIEEMETRTTTAVNNLNTEKDQAITELNEVKEANRTRRLDAVATIAERDALTPQQGDTVTVLNDGQGNTVEYQFSAGEWKVTDKVSATAYAELNQQLADTKKNVGSIENFGGVVDGVTNNSTAFTTAFNSSGAVYIFLPPGKTLTSQLFIPANKNVVIEGSGKDVSELHCTGRFFATTNTEKFTTTLTSGIFKGDVLVSVNSSEGIREGQLVTFTSTENMEETARAPVRKTHSAIVTKVETGSITLDRGFPINFSTDGFTVTVKGYDVGSIRIANMTISGEYDGYFGDITNAKNFQAENVKVVNRHKGYQGETSTGGFNPSQTGGTMHGFRVQYSVDSEFINTEFEYLSYGVMPTLGAVGVSIVNPKATRCRHTAAPTGGSQNVSVESANAYECFAGFDSHETAYDTTHLNCRSYADEIQVKLRGRMDSVINCHFDGGLSMTHDSALRSLKDRENFRKVITSVSMNGELTVAGSINFSGKDFLVNGRFQNYGVVDTLDISEGTIVMDKFDYGVDSSGNPNNYSLWLNVCKKTVINNVRFLGPYKGIPQTADIPSSYGLRAVRIDRNDFGGTVKMANVVIDGFDFGMDFPLAMNLEGFVFEDIFFKNCVRGINNATNSKDNPTFNRISFSGCAVNVREPFRFRYINRPASPMKGQKYWDQTLKKDITFDGTNWVDAMGNLV